MWQATVDGQTLHFHLAGINNQNFLMRDEETGSWWQQITGQAIFGPLKGRRLKPVPQDEISFALWKREHAEGRVLRPDPALLKAGKYAPADWEARIARLPVATRTHDSRLAPRELVVGMVVDGTSKAYPMADVRRQSPIVDIVGGVPVVVVAAADGNSVRAFRRTFEGQTLELYALAGGPAGTLVDSATGSEWDFAGRAIRGPLEGRRLAKIEVLRDYWFDWRTYHSGTEIFRTGLPRVPGGSATAAR